MTSISDSISTLKGIGPKKESLFALMGINTLGDLVNHFPYTYQDRRIFNNISDLTEGSIAHIKCKVTLVVTDKYRKNKKQNLRILVSDETGSLDVVFFNANYLLNTIKVGDPIVLYGRASINRGKVQLTHPEITNLKMEKYQPKILPIYRTIKGISQKEIRKNIDLILENQLEFEEELPLEIVKKNKLCPRDFAINNLHHPQSKEHLKVAKFRMIFEELFVLQLGLTMMKRGVVDGIPLTADHEEFIKLLPYELTRDQQKVVDEITSDLCSNKAMNRLLQGDVGSGKTVVAEIALYKTVKSGFQGGFMAPTEILANQHYESLKAHFEPLGITVGLLTGSMKEKEKENTVLQLVEQKIDIIVGTHALIQEKVSFGKLGLVITDEQHRFGVNQRAILSEKGGNPHILVMTATPIPRTLAVVLYSDLSISTIKELPKGRKKIITEINSKSKTRNSYDSLIDQIKLGHQGYVVCPLIEESEVIDANSAIEVYEKLKIQYKELNIGLVHGQMKQSDKDSIMLSFKNKEIDILVSTVVIEVGIDVPNATVMIIENAERFGLAQLHQLRGRVGRGQDQSYCYLNNYSDGEISKKRLKVIASSTDGFYISEKDMELRGPGEIFGTRQHGIPDMEFADLVRHIDLLETIREQITDLEEIDEKILKKVEKIFGKNVNIKL
ncbi:MAG: ATP-dependent DNA helicase RecG [Anaerovoracaceae bacterium]